MEPRDDGITLPVGRGTALPEERPIDDDPRLPRDPFDGSRDSIPLRLLKLDGGRGTLWLNAIWVFSLRPADVPARGPKLCELMLCGGRGTKWPPGAIDDIEFPRPSGPRAIELSPRTGEVLGPRTEPATPRDAAGGVMRLTVGRENELLCGLAAGIPALGPRLAERVGVAFSRPKLPAPRRSFAVTLTEFPRTAIPRSKLLRDIAVTAPGRFMNRGFATPLRP